MNDPSFIAAVAGSTLAWIMAYVLMTRRGILDASFGMPVTALCVNISWELYFTFLVDAPVPARLGNGLFLLFDLGVLYTCLRYSRNDYNWPIFHKYFRIFVIGMLLISSAAVYLFITSFNDYGIMSTLFAQILYSSLFVAMLIRRNSVTGQSLYIGLLILVGDTFGLYAAPYTQENFQPEVPLIWIFAVTAYILAAHVFYLMLYVHIARRDGINVWRRV